MVPINEKTIDIYGNETMTPSARTMTRAEYLELLELKLDHIDSPPDEYDLFDDFYSEYDYEGE